ncbi:MAG TPA: hypothetical protein VJP78_11455 [Thermoleophilia bacterium]|nr:hypothetical protein [Thermoleophilia bacterium]
MTEATESEGWSLIFVELETGQWELRRHDTDEVLVIFKDRAETLSFGYAVLEWPEVVQVTFKRAQEARETG